MNRLTRRIIVLCAFIISAILCGYMCFSNTAVYADKDDNCVPTSIIGNGKVCDDGKGDSVTHIIKLVVEILTIGIGILGVIGISITGIQYLTAGGSEEKAAKAKRRMLEIVIGLAVYAVLWAIVTWLFVNPSSITSSSYLNNTVI